MGMKPRKKPGELAWVVRASNEDDYVFLFVGTERPVLRKPYRNAWRKAWMQKRTELFRRPLYLSYDVALCHEQFSRFYSKELPVGVPVRIRIRITEGNP